METPATFEVELDHGRIIARSGGDLPATGRGILKLLVEDGPAEEREAEERARNIHEFLQEWSGAFASIPQPASGEDPRLEYLLRKHVK